MKITCIVLTGMFVILVLACQPSETRRTPDPTAPRTQLVTSNSGSIASPEKGPNPSGSSKAGFGLEEFPHFPVDAIVRIDTQLGAGSGFIFLTREDTAYVMTNAHVVDGASSITVRVRNAEEYDAVFLGGDSIVDIAVLSLCCSYSFEEIPLRGGLTVTNPVAWSDNADTAWVGDPLVVVGYPRGVYNLVATSGKIHTVLDTASGSRVVHDAFAEPGNSGSPILSPDGRLMGVHFAGSVHGEQYFFLVPFEEAEYWASQWLPGTDPSDADVPMDRRAVTIRFTNMGTEMLAAAASEERVPKRGLWVTMAPDPKGFEWYFFNQRAMTESQEFSNLLNSAPEWDHRNVSAEDFEVRLNTFHEDCGTIASVVRNLQDSGDDLQEITPEELIAAVESAGYTWASAEAAEALAAQCPKHPDWPSLPADMDGSGELLECERSPLSDDWASLFTCRKPS